MTQAGVYQRTISRNQPSPPGRVGMGARLRAARTVLFVCMLLPGLAPGLAMAQVETPGRQQLERLAQDLETFEARFEQQVIGTDGAIADASEGRLWLAQPHFFRWEYGGDFPEVVVADGRHIWIHDVELEQVTVKPQSTAAADSPLTLLTDIDRLDREFEVREAGEIDGASLLELRPVSGGGDVADAEFERILLGLRDDTLELMAMEDAFGLRTEIRFHDVRRNQPIDPAQFTFDPPPDVDVIGTATPP
ncbi:LolA family protein [Elongatibacter sediminis]|uniref:Outer-membrane lipoprotein carrier protein n=1 Tax=Elongatibacter sediminis TaxID=3119006 RepID=A0AAW9RHC4_9GAMM